MALIGKKLLISGRECRSQSNTELKKHRIARSFSVKLRAELLQFCGKKLIIPGRELNHRGHRVEYSTEKHKEFLCVSL